MTIDLDTDDVLRPVSEHWTNYARQRPDGRIDIATRNVGTERDDPDAEWVYDTVLQLWLDRAPERSHTIEPVAPDEFPEKLDQ